MILLQLYCYDMLTYTYLSIIYLVPRIKIFSYYFLTLINNQYLTNWKEAYKYFMFFANFWNEFSIKIYINESFCIPLNFLQQHCCVKCKIFFDAKKYVSFRFAIFLHQFTKEHKDWTKIYTAYLKLLQFKFANT